jgi:hypothetical protein
MRERSILTATFVPFVAARGDSSLGKRIAVP